MDPEYMSHQKEVFRLRRSSQETVGGACCYLSFSGNMTLTNTLALNPSRNLHGRSQDSIDIKFIVYQANNIAKSASHKGTMHFGRHIHRFLDFILAEDPYLGPEYLCKVNLEDAYIRIWLLLEDVTSVDFLIMKEIEDTDHIVGVSPLDPHGLNGFHRPVSDGDINVEGQGSGTHLQPTQHQISPPVSFL